MNFTIEVLDWINGQPLACFVVAVKGFQGLDFGDVMTSNGEEGWCWGG